MEVLIVILALLICWLAGTIYSSYFTLDIPVQGMIAPQVLTTTTTLNSPSIDLNKYGSAFFNFQTGAFGGTTPTLSAVLQIQESTDNATWTNNATVGSYTLANSSFTNSTVTSGSTSVTITSTTGVQVGQVVTDSLGDIPAGTTVAAVVDSTHILLSKAATASSSADTVYIGGQNDQATLEVLASQLGSGKRYVRLNCVCTIGGTTPTIPVALNSYGYKPQPAANVGLSASGVVNQTYV